MTRFPGALQEQARRIFGSEATQMLKQITRTARRLEDARRRNFRPTKRKS